MNKRLGEAAFIVEGWILLKELTGLFGLDISGLQASLTEDSQGGDIEGMINKRLEAKKRKDFSEADRLRKELEAKGIILKDTKDGTTWHRKI
jgi:cysteinyl-tRNA synthetase